MRQECELEGLVESFDAETLLPETVEELRSADVSRVAQQVEAPARQRAAYEWTRRAIEWWEPDPAVVEMVLLILTTCSLALVLILVVLYVPIS
ncbi:hypothetical protein [Streptomyces sp. AK02-04a]|uniref:hypothetical protein n=1 Tax=Streptomyces sp. AK02-04a TaxID=3028649 RepID=UPI0029AF1B48|nr:hypothetical protein [Streptomyces sp. AK02-04a]MDX3763983.1 hypothetical protein [Streptomyces sp. AK02-04a]